MKRILYLAFALAFSSVSLAQTNRTRRPQNPPQQKLSARKIAQRTAPSVVLLVTTDEDGNPTALGSGFFAANYRIATNYHVVKDASEIFAKLVGRRGIYKISFVENPDKENDLVLLNIGVKGQPLKLGNLSRLQVGDEIYVMGNPEGLEGTFSRGNVSAIRSGKDLIQITAPISHGSSGGPVLDERGEVIGIAASILSKGQNLNFAIPVSKLAELLKPEKNLENDLRAGTVTDSAPSSSAPREPVPEWQFIGLATKGEAMYYISRARITSTPENTLLCWIKTVPLETSEGRAFRKRHIDQLDVQDVPRRDAFSYSMEQYEFDCGHRKWRVLTAADYDEEGILLFAWGDLTSRWVATFPGSVIEAQLNFACKGRE
ncbi:MAG: S1C family serine protease [Pyrinomonadaceae bacterium]|nr:S1C family serine protease [Pyrinomonadaceae bacterium]